MTLTYEKQGSRLGSEYVARVYNPSTTTTVITETPVSEEETPVSEEETPAEEASE